MPKYSLSHINKRACAYILAQRAEEMRDKYPADEQMTRLAAHVEIAGKHSIPELRNLMLTYREPNKGLAEWVRDFRRIMADEFEIFIKSYNHRAPIARTAKHKDDHKDDHKDEQPTRPATSANDAVMRNLTIVHKLDR